MISLTNHDSSEVAVLNQRPTCKQIEAQGTTDEILSGYENYEPSIDIGVAITTNSISL